MNRSVRIFVVAIGFAGFLSFSIPLNSAAPARVRLFEDARTVPAGLPGENDPAKRRRLVRINPSWIVRSEKAAWAGPHARHTIKLFDDTEITLIIDRTHFKEKGRFTIIGHIDGVKASQVVLAFYQGVINGSFLMPGIGVFHIRSTSKGFHWIVEQDPNTRLDCLVPGSP